MSLITITIEFKINEINAQRKKLILRMGCASLKMEEDARKDWAVLLFVYDSLTSKSKDEDCMRIYMYEFPAYGESTYM